MTTGESNNETTSGLRQPDTLRSTISGLETIIEAKIATANVEVENLEKEGEMYAEGKTGVAVFEEVSVTNRACEFVGINPGGGKTTGKVETQPLKASTKGQAVGVVKVEPQTGTKLAEFELSGASCPAALKGAYPVFGSVLATTSEGVTTRWDAETVTAEPAPKLRLKNATTGPLAGFEGKLTTRAGKPKTTTPEWHALSLT